MPHICVGKLTIIGSDNSLSPGWRQAIIWTNAGILLIEPPETNFNEILINIHTFSFKKMHLKMLSGIWWPFCPGLNVFTHLPLVLHICASELGKHWFRQWLVAYSAPSHYLNQCQLITNWTHGNKLQWKFNQNTRLFIHKKSTWKYCLRYGGHFVQGEMS